MPEEREASPLVIEVARIFLRQLRGDEAGASLQDLIAGAKHHLKEPLSTPTGRRALHWLRDEASAPVVFEAGGNRWRLTDPSFALPLLDPTPDDLTALVFAGALLESIGDEELNNRVRRIVEEMDAKLRESDGAPRDVPRGHAVTATLTTSTPVDPRMLATLVRAVKRHVVRFDYYSPWTDQTKMHELEPWQVRCHDGRLYLRGYARAARGPLNYRIAHVSNLSVLQDRTPSEGVPQPHEVWATADIAYGVDEDRPGHATLQIEGPMARWVQASIWHPSQEDQWLHEGKVLQRTLPYGSCRELARRLLSLGDSIRAIEPQELRDEVQGHAQALAKL
jgi:predicted DNA-binding transcriptional regulator YafY